MQFLVIGWLVLNITNSSSQLGFVIFLYGAPNFTMLLLGGLIADRLNRRNLVIATQTTSGIIIFALASFVMVGNVEMIHIYLAAFILGMVQGLELPGRMALISNLVNRKHIMNAVALNSAGMNIGRFIGPAIAGLIIDIFGLGSATLCHGCCYLIGIIFLTQIKMRPGNETRDHNSALQDLSEGLRYFASTRIVWTIIGLGFAFGLFASPYLEIMSGFGKTMLDADAGRVGLLIASAGLGSILGNIVLASLGDFKHRNILMIGSLILFALTLLMFAWCPWFWVSCAILVFVGIGSMSYVSLGTTVLQLYIPPELLGRVMSFWTLGAALKYVGALPIGLIADLFNWTIALSIGSLLFLAVILLLGILNPTLRRMNV